MMMMMPDDDDDDDDSDDDDDDDDDDFLCRGRTVSWVSNVQRTRQKGRTMLNDVC